MSPQVRRRPTLASRTTLVTTTVATVAVLLAGVVSSGLLATTGATQARRALARQANLLAGLLDHGAGSLNSPPAVRRLIQTLHVQQGITVVRVAPNGAVAGYGRVSAPTAASVAGGQSVSDVERLAGRRVFVEARPLDGGGGLVLEQSVSRTRELTGPIRIRVLLALLVGLSVAIVAGLVLSRRLARPLQEAAFAAHRMAAGERGIAMTPSGPAEVAEVTEALTALDSALGRSEARQREFLLSISHELRTPLTGIRGFAEALQDGVTDDPRAAGSTILAEANRLERLVSDLLDLARLGADDFRLDLAAVDLSSLVAEAAAVWGARCAAEGVEFRYESEPNPVSVLADPGRVRQIVDGLAENALRVTPTGAPLILAVRQGAGTSAGYGVVEVRDGGPGLTDEDCLVAFDRSTLYERYRGVRRVGTGLGLALVAGLVGRMGGHAVAGKAPEGGASFTVLLPVA